MVMGLVVIVNTRYLVHVSQIVCLFFLGGGGNGDIQYTVPVYLY